MPHPFGTSDSLRSGLHLGANLSLISKGQSKTGFISESPGGGGETWNHFECTMALCLGGDKDAAANALRWPLERLEAEGTLFAVYDAQDQSVNARSEPHHIGYWATALLFYCVHFGEDDLLRQLYQPLRKAVDSTLSQQLQWGAFRWASVTPNQTDAANDHAAKAQALASLSEHTEDALLISTSSMVHGLECAAVIAERMDDRQSSQRWLDARELAIKAICHHEALFDQTWPSKDRFAMHWYYPVLCNALGGDMQRMRSRLKERWKVFIDHGLGCRCVCDRPWVTVAETCELVMALVRVDMRQEASQLLHWLPSLSNALGVFPMGYAWDDLANWPLGSSPTWTAAAVVLAESVNAHPQAPTSQILAGSPQAALATLPSIKAS